MARAQADAAIRRHVLTLARANRRGRRVRVTYRDASGALTQREVDVFGLSFQDGRWYALVHCHLRRAVRLLRLDRLLAAELTARAARSRPPRGFDAAFFASAEYLEPGAPVAHLASIRLAAPLDAAAPSLFPRAALERAGRFTVCHVRASRPATLAGLVASLGEGAEVVMPLRPTGDGGASGPSRA